MCLAVVSSSMQAVQHVQWADALALAGDKTDGIPGVEGVAETIAIRLLQVFGDLHGLEQNAHKARSVCYRYCMPVHCSLPDRHCQRNAGCSTKPVAGTLILCRAAFLKVPDM